MMSAARLKMDSDPAAASSRRSIVASPSSPLVSFQPKEMLSFKTSRTQLITMKNHSFKRVLYKVKTNGPAEHFSASPDHGLIRPRGVQEVFVSYTPFLKDHGNHGNHGNHGVNDNYWLQVHLTELSEGARILEDICWKSIPSQRIVLYHLKLSFPRSDGTAEKVTHIPRWIGVGDPVVDTIGPQCRRVAALSDVARRRQVWDPTRNQMWNRESDDDTDKEVVKRTLTSRDPRPLEGPTHPNQSTNRSVELLLASYWRVLFNACLFCMAVFVGGIVLGRAGF